MPELPEVETIRRDLVANILNQKIETVALLSPKTAKNEAVLFVDTIKNSCFDNIERYGKLLAFHLKTNKDTAFDYLLVHLKMTGQLILVSPDKKLAGGHSLGEDSFLEAVGGALPNKHTRAIFSFKGKTQLFFNDLRKFGYLKLVTNDELKKIVAASYGPEPLTARLTPKYLYESLKNRKSSIKALLLNQKIIAGLGNIYVDEALFLSKIRPDRLGSSLNLHEINGLLKAINKVIEKAILNRGTTFSNYLDSKGQKGNFSRLLQVYGRGQKTCYKCGGSITKFKLAGRGTHFCSNCQK